MSLNQVGDLREQVSALEQRLEAALEKNTKLTVFRQVCSTVTYFRIFT